MPSRSMARASLRICEMRDSVTSSSLGELDRRAAPRGSSRRSTTRWRSGSRPIGVAQVAEQLAGLEGLGRLDGGAVGQHVAEGEVLAGVVAAVTRVLEGEHDRAVHAVADGGELGSVPCPWRRRRRRLTAAPAAVGEVGSTASRARPRARTERGAQSTARTASRMAPRMRRAAKRSNGHAADRVVALGGLDQPEGAGPGELLAVDVAGEVARDLQDHVAHQREVLLDRALRVSVASAILRGPSGSARPADRYRIFLR